MLIMFSSITFKKDKISQKWVGKKKKKKKKKAISWMLFPLQTSYVLSQLFVTHLGVALLFVLLFSLVVRRLAYQH